MPSHISITRTEGASHAPVVRPPGIFRWLPTVLAAVAALALYAVTLGGSYFYDDTILREDPRFTHPDQWPQFWTRDYMPNAVDRLYRPLTCLTFAIEYFLHGDRPWIYHLVNVLLHAGASVAVAELARRLTNVRIACAAGILFAVHPIHVEAVAGLVGRAELLCTLATLVGSILFLRPMTSLRAAAISACAVAALLSKEQGILFPAMLLALTLYRRQILNIHSTSDNVKVERGAMNLLTAAVCLITAAYLIFREQTFGFGWDRRSLDWAVNPLVLSMGSDKILMPLTLLGRYMGLLVAPTKLSIDYSARVIGWTVNWREPYVYIGVVALFAWIVAFGWSFRRRKFATLFCLLAFAMSYGIVSNAFVLIGTIFGERLMYMPSAFFLILAAALLDFLLPPRFFATAIVILGTLGFIRSFTYARLCNDPAALYLADLRDHPNSMGLHGLVVNQYMTAGQYREARIVGQDCLNRLPDCWQSYVMCVEPDLGLRDFADAERVMSHVDPRAVPGRIAQLRAQIEFQREASEKKSR
ncbi:MAG TPA: hypothetical protein VG326_19655 [Tepidisphaeraceae bacterium]|nr:hypothetical protein [Tepidisphaeraceae bacterium]